MTISVFGRRRQREEQKKQEQLGPVMVHCTITGEAIEAPKLVVDGDGAMLPEFVAIGVLESQSRVTFTVPGTVQKWGFFYRWIVDGIERSLRATKDDGSDLPLPPAGDWEGPVLDFTHEASAITAAGGPVTLDGRVWVGRSGPFFPMASTLFWAVGGVKVGQEARVADNFAYIKENGGAAVRILAQVKWDGEIGNADERWPDYEAVLGRTIDLATAAGLLVKVTCIGGGVQDLRLLTEKLCRVLPARRDAILMVEGCNEGNASDDDLKYLLGTLMPLLPGVPWSVGLGDQGDRAIKLGQKLGSTVDCLHTERALGDKNEPGGPHARQARQGWNFVDGSRKAKDWGEPAGITSSVEQLDDADIMAAAYACSLICGAGSGCCHCGSGVFGKDYDSKYGHRYANLREVPGLSEQMRAMCAAAAQIPVEVGNWQPFNNPLIVERVNLSPNEGLGRGECNKIYGARAGNRFIEIVIGCDPVVRLKGAPGCVYKVTNTATGEVIADGITGGREVTLTAGCWSYLVIGTT